MTAPSDYCKLFFSLLLLPPPPPSFSFLNLTAFVCFVKIIQIVVLDAHFFGAVLPCRCGFPGGASGKEPASQCRRRKRHRFNPWVGKMPWGGHGNPLQYSCLENPHGQRSLVGQSPCGHPELDTTEATYYAPPHAMFLLRQIPL